MRNEHLTILGDGQMGLVCAAILAQRGVGSVTLWGHDRSDIDALAQTRRSARLSGFILPEAVRATGDDAQALRGASLVVVAVPTQFIGPVLGRLRRHMPEAARAPVVSVAKGIETGSLERPSEIIARSLGEMRADGASSRGFCVLSGPTIAAELARCLPATMIAASTDEALARRVQGLFTTNWLRVYTGSDPLGVEIAGATKNVIAIAAGILDGLQAGANAKSALLARGLAEIARLGTALGARPETFFGLAGVGDLATTCFSPEGRNRSCGEALGRGERLESYLARTDSVVEGVATTRAVMGLAGSLRVEMPITEAVNAVLYGGVDPIDAIARLMGRELKAERVG